MCIDILLLCKYVNSRAYHISDFAYNCLWVLSMQGKTITSYLYQSSKIAFTLEAFEAF